MVTLGYSSVALAGFLGIVYDLFEIDRRIERP
jgi:hypothetical protein